MSDLGWVIWDAYCGLGGWSSGALAALEDAGMTATFYGVDSDKVPLEAWKRNISKSPAVVAAKTLCKSIGTNAMEWPSENGRLVMHWSPCCQPFSKARITPAPESAVDGGLSQIRALLDLVLEKGYARWTIEEVAHPQIVALVKEYSQKFPSKIAGERFDAASYGCPSERRRLIVSSPELLRDLKTRTTTEYQSPKRALLDAGIEPASAFYRNGNVSCAPRPVSMPAFTITASHPLVFCNQDRSLVRCMNPKESAVLVGLPPDWELPNGSGAAQRAVGNVVAPPLAKAIVASALVLQEPEEPVTATAPVTRAEVAAMITAAIAPLRVSLRKRIREGE